MCDILKFNYPYWENLPELDLYLDQVLLYVNQICQPLTDLTDKRLTASMVNNYVKHGHLAKPFKKKYTKSQVARLIVITTFKIIFPIQDISQTLNTLSQQFDTSDLYNGFVAYMNEGAHDAVTPIITTSCRTLQLYYDTYQLIQPLIKEE